MSSTLWLIIGCGILSIVYAVWAIQSVMAADAGNARMQEIAGAIREGATAYLNRQYTTIAIVGALCSLQPGCCCPARRPSAS
jgi:K(+)-stimulated pyrophosphate-energized sodium pump